MNIIDNEILVTLNAKDKTTRKGATVTISELKSEKFLDYVRKDIVELFNKLEKDDNIEKIAQNIGESSEILKQIEIISEKLQKKEPQNKNEEIRELSKGLRALVEKYHFISSQKETLSKTHQALQKNLQSLAKKSKKWSKHLSATTKKKSDIEKELIEQQSLRWLEGSKNFLSLAEQIGAYNKTLQELFKTLNENAQIFYETANSIDLNLNPLENVLGKLVDSKSVLQNLDKHWQVINKLKENLKNNGFL